MDRFAPGFSSSVLETKLYLPPDIESILGMPGGNTLHGEMTLDQLFFMRPAPGLSNDRSCIRGLYRTLPSLIDGTSSVPTLEKNTPRRPCVSSRITGASPLNSTWLSCTPMARSSASVSR